MKKDKNNNTEENSSRDIYICIYNENSIGLFKRISWNTKPKKTVVNDYIYDAGNIYVGIDNDHIGMDKTHEEMFNKDNWEPIGTCVKHNKKMYISDCKIEKAINVDEMRLDMYLDGEIVEYAPGRATSKELLDALSYAYKYYNLDREEVKQKKKSY